jgi:excisionase family DNA binding protein
MARGEGKVTTKPSWSRDAVLRLIEEAGVTIPADATIDEPLITTGQAAALLRCSDRTIRTWADEGKIAVFRTLGGRRLFPVSSVLAAMRSMHGNSARPDASPREVGDAGTRS